MEERYQFSMRNALVATAWLAVLFANLGWSYAVQDGVYGFWGVCLWAALLAGPPAAATGALLGRPLTGFLCGLSSALVLVLWCLWVYFHR
jgi:hypothetical protein